MSEDEYRSCIYKRCVADDAVDMAPSPEYTPSGDYRSRAAGGSTQRAVLALDCCLASMTVW
jgi:hypothetical protein